MTTIFNSLFDIIYLIMHDELLDDNFIIESVVPIRKWWESQRLKYNKVCLAGCVPLLVLIIIHELLNDNGLGITIFLLLGLFYFIAGNIAYTFSWITENIFQSVFNQNWPLRFRKFVFWSGICLTYLLPVLLFILVLL